MGASASAAGLEQQQRKSDSGEVSVRLPRSEAPSANGSKRKKPQVVEDLEDEGIVEVASDCSLGLSSDEDEVDKNVLRQSEDSGNGPDIADNDKSKSGSMPPIRPVSTKIIGDYKPQGVEINKEMVEKYLELDKEIRSQEGRKTLNTLKAKKQQLEELDRSIKPLQNNYKQLEQNTAKEKQDVDHMQSKSVKSFFKNQTEFEEQLSKEQQEYLEALSQQEAAKKELDNVNKQRNAVKKEVDMAMQEAEHLQDLYKQQEDLLASIFGGRYGSEKEFKLESQLDMQLERKQRISAAKYRWQNARILMQHAVGQLAYAVRRWQEIRKNEQDMHMKYHMVAEVRNNQIAAVQNIQSAQRYLHTINFPYCKPDEVETLSKAINNIFTDMQSADRHDHAQQCYQTMHRRAGALIQWFDQVKKVNERALTSMHSWKKQVERYYQAAHYRAVALKQWMEEVLNNIILKDLTTASNECKTKQRELRAERITLIKAKIKDVLNEDVEVGEGWDLDDFDQDELEPELADLCAEADRVSIAGSDDQLLAGPTDYGGVAPTPIPLNELAPLPTVENLFGNIQNLKKEHEKEMQEFERQQGQNRARMDLMLQQKMEERKKRRTQMNSHQKEIKVQKPKKTNKAP